jgi:hypothetical protein
MHKWTATWLVLSVFIGCANAQQQQQSPPPPQPAGAASGALSADAPVDTILDALDARGKDLSDFTAAVTLATTDTAIGNETRQIGRIWMQRLGGAAGGDSRLRVLFDRKEVNDKVTSERQEYQLAGGMLVERNYTDRREVRRQVLKPGQKMDLLKLGEGPFPLPLGQDKADVHRMFNVAKIAPANDDPPGTIHVQLKPKPGTQFEDKFASIDFWVDPTSRMPVKIVTEDPNGTTQRTTELKEIAVNAKLADKDFELPAINEGEWTIRQQTFDE